MVLRFNANAFQAGSLRSVSESTGIRNASNSPVGCCLLFVVLFYDTLIFCVFSDAGGVVCCFVCMCGEGIKRGSRDCRTASLAICIKLTSG